MTHRLAVLALLAVLPAAQSARGEDVLPMPAGTRVRLTLGAKEVAGTVQGTLIRLAPGTLGVVDAERGAIVTVPDASVIRVQTSPGPRRHARTGAIIGAAMGASAAFLATSGAGANCAVDETLYAPCTSANRAGWMAFGGVFYGGVGALIGHFVRTETWSDAPVERVKLAARFERGGGRFAVAFSF